MIVSIVLPLLAFLIDSPHIQRDLVQENKMLGQHSKISEFQFYLCFDILHHLCTLYYHSEIPVSLPLLIIIDLSGK